MPRHKIDNSTIRLATTRWVSSKDTLINVTASCSKCGKDIIFTSKLTEVDKREFYDSEILLHVKDGLEKLREDECLGSTLESTVPQSPA